MQEMELLVATRWRTKKGAPTAIEWKMKLGFAVKCFAHNTTPFHLNVISTLFFSGLRSATVFLSVCLSNEEVASRPRGRHNASNTEAAHRLSVGLVGDDTNRPSTSEVLDRCDATH